MKALENYVIRQAERKEIAFFISQAKEEGWNPGLNDGGVFYDTDPDGFFIGEIDGQPIAIISAVRYNDFGFLGFYIVKKAYRNHGYGLRLWNYAMDYLSDCHIGVDGVVLEQGNYKKSGFKFHHPHLRFEGWAFPNPNPNPAIVAAKRVDFETLLAYDTRHFPSQRASFLKSWLRMDNAESLVYLEHAKIKGMGTIRKCYHGYKIGPLFAETPKIAEELFLNLVFFAETMPVYIDVSQDNKDALDLVLRYKMNFVFEAVRMYNKRIPELPQHKIYGNTSFELG